MGYKSRSHITGMHSKSIETRTATSTVFSCPTRLISDVHSFLEITAAINTSPLLFVAFDAVMCAPSGDQLMKRVS